MGFTIISFSAMTLFSPFPCHVLRGALNKSWSVYSPATIVAVVLMTTSIRKVTPQPTVPNSQAQISCSLSIPERYLTPCKLGVEISSILKHSSIAFLTFS